MTSLQVTCGVRRGQLLPTTQCQLRWPVPWWIITLIMVSLYPVCIPLMYLDLCTLTPRVRCVSTAHTAHPHTTSSEKLPTTAQTTK